MTSKKSLFKYISLAAVILCLSACTKDNVRFPNGSDGDNEPGLVQCSYTVMVEAPVDAQNASNGAQYSWTDASVDNCQTDETSGEAGVQSYLSDDQRPVWSVGDSLSVYDRIAKTARIFTVSAIKDGVATIVGSITPGDSLFSAVYPASAVLSWKDENTCNLRSLPSNQSIASGKNIASNVLISRAYTTTPGDQILFTNESSLLKFTIDRTDISSIDFTLRSNSGDKKYTLTPSGSMFERGKTYYLAVQPGTYNEGLDVECNADYGVHFSKSSANGLIVDKSVAKRLGCLTNSKRYVDYSVFSTVAIGDMTTYLEDSGLLEGLDASTLALIKMAISMYFPWNKKTVRLVKYNYPSIGPGGSRRMLSAIMAVPECAFSGTAINGGVLVSHTAITKEAECPTKTDPFEAATVWKGYAVVLSDYVGFGADSANPQAFLDGETAARGSIDAYQAGMKYLRDNGVKMSDTIVNLGYSQGGFNALANVKYVSEHQDFCIKFTKSFIGSGPYDIKASWTDYLSGTYPEASTFAPITVLSFNINENLGLSYDRLFKEPLLSNYQNWILSKNYSRGQIDSKIGSKDITKILADPLFDSTSAEYKAIYGVCERFTLIGGWKPTAGSDIYVYHSTQDDVVPYSNFTSLKTFLEANAKDSTLHFKSGADGGHIDSVIQFAYFVVNNW